MVDVKTPIFFNVNHQVCVRLTQHGREIHQRNHYESWARYFGKVTSGEAPTPTPEFVVQYHPPKEQPDGWSEWQAWDLMNEFGHAMGNGMRVPFETEIFIGTHEQLRAALKAAAQGEQT